MKQLVLSAALMLSFSACTGRHVQPVTVSSAASVAYAARFPEQLEATRSLLAEEKTKAQTISSELGGRAKELKAPYDSELVLSIVEAADESGKGEAFAQAHVEDRAVRNFWEEERGPIGSRVNNAVQQKASEAKCESTDLTGSVPYALRDGVDRQLEKRLRAQNEAHLLIERNKATLGANVATLQKLADDIAFNSYLVNIALVDDANRVQRMLGDKRGVSRTLDDAIEQEHHAQETAQNGPERKASAERLATYTKSRAEIDNVTANAEGEVKTSDEQVRAARTEYEDALSALKDEIRKSGTAR